MKYRSISTSPDHLDQATTKAKEKLNTLFTAICLYTRLGLGHFTVLDCSEQRQNNYHGHTEWNCQNKQYYHQPNLHSQTKEDIFNKDHLTSIIEAKDQRSKIGNKVIEIR